MSIPYPARRKYTWLDRAEPFEIDEAIALCRRMRRQQPAAQNPARHRAFEILVAALNDIAHRHDVNHIKPAKLHALLCAAATEAGWFTDPTMFRRKRKPALPGMLHCTGCDQYLPAELFKRDRLSHLCEDCRDARAKRLEAKEQAREIARCKERFERLMGVHDGLSVDSLLRPIMLQRRNERNREWLARHLRTKLSSTPTLDAQRIADVYPYYHHMLHTLHRDTRHAVNRHTNEVPNQPKAEYHRIKLALVQKARNELERRLDEGDLYELTRGQVHWTRLLTSDEIDTLEQAHATMSAALRRSEQIPPLVTVRTLERDLEALADELRRASSK